MASSIAARQQLASRGRTSSTPAQSPSCVTSSYGGLCGPYEYPLITQSNTGSYGIIRVGNNVYNPKTPTTETLTVYNPGNWNAVANMPAGNTSVISYPSTGMLYPLPGDATIPPTSALPLSMVQSLYSSYAENKGDVNASTAVDVGYDMWMTTTAIIEEYPNSGWYAYEMMIQHDIVNRGAICGNAVQATFGGTALGSPDVLIPEQEWQLCAYRTGSSYGPELIWSPVSNPNQTSGTVDILSMVLWCINNGYIPADPDISLGAFGYGFEICSTGGVDEVFSVTSLSAPLVLGSLPMETSPGIELSGFGAFSAISPGQVVNSVTVTVTDYQSDSRQNPCMIELWDYSGTPAQIGVSQKATPGISNSNTSVTAFTGVTYSQLATLRVRLYGNSLYSGFTESVGGVSLVANYSNPPPPPAFTAFMRSSRLPAGGIDGCRL